MAELLPPSKPQADVRLALFASQAHCATLEDRAKTLEHALRDALDIIHRHAGWEGRDWLAHHHPDWLERRHG